VPCDEMENGVLDLSLNTIGTVGCGPSRTLGARGFMVGVWSGAERQLWRMQVHETTVDGRAALDRRHSSTQFICSSESLRLILARC
jgi:hypothetical protein